MADEKTVENGKKPYHSPEVNDELSEKEAEQVTGGVAPHGPSPGGPSPG
jgi:hypothetical protein